MKKNNTELLDFLKKRYKSAKKFTIDKYIKQAIRSMNDYDTVDADVDLTTKHDKHRLNINSRYEYTIPLIFTNVESFKATLFDRLPDLIIKGRGKNDENKELTINAAYEYLKDKLDLNDFAFQSAHWFLLTGFCSAQANYEKRGQQVDTGMLDENGEPIMDTVYTYDDPIIELLDPKKAYFSCESKFDPKASKVPYYFFDKIMTPADIKAIYGKEVSPDTSIDETDDIEAEIGGIKEKDMSNDHDRCKVHFYCGDIINGDKVKEYGLEYSQDKVYYVVYTDNEILHITDKEDKMLRCAKWYGHPNTFFGYGLGKLGRQFQIEKSIRRGQQIRIADVAAFPKIAIKDSDIQNNKDLLDPRANTIVQYSETPPQILQPGNLSQSVSVGLEQAEQDAQRAFGMLDLSTASQSSTVKTATGQTMFSEASQRRTEYAKKQFMSYYRECVIMLLKLCQQNWDEEKVVSITDEDGKEQEVTLTAESLADIDFDKDIDIDMETLSVNKDVVRQQYIVLYDKTKGDALIDRKQVIRDMMNKGFEVKDSDKYIKQTELQPGMILVDPQTQQQYQVDENGEVVPAVQESEPAPSSSNFGDSIPTDSAGVSNMLPKTNDLGI